MYNKINIPFASFRNEEDEAAIRRKKLAEALNKNQKISVTPAGEVEVNTSESTSNIIIPEGKLA